jgi:hypothetical protein
VRIRAASVGIDIGRVPAGMDAEEAEQDRDEGDLEEKLAH